jgi:hypothetical protein
MSSAFFPELTPKFGSAEAEWPESSNPYEQKTKYWLNAAFEEAESDQKESEELREINKYINYLNSKQWGEQRPQFKSRPVNNKMYDLFWELVGLLTDIRPIIEVKTNQKGENFLKQQEVLNNAIRYWWLNTDADLSLAMCIIFGILTTGFAKLQWNRQLNLGQGDLEMVPVSPDNILLLKPGQKLQSAQACIYKEINAVGDVKRKYPRRAHLVRPDMQLSKYQTGGNMPSNMTTMQFQMLSPALQRKMGGSPQLSPSSYPMCLVKEFWLKDYDSYNTSNVDVEMGDGNWKYIVKPKELIYPRGRLIVMAGEEIVADSPNPYWHGQFPFAMLRLNPVPWALYGMSDLRRQTHMQDIVNNLLAGVIDLIKKAVNPPFYAPKNAFDPATWGAIDWSMPGARAQYSTTAVHEPKFAPIPQPPPIALPLLQHIERGMDQGSGIAAASEMVKKKQVPSGDTLDQFRQSQSNPVRLKGRNVEVFMRDMGGMQVSNMMQFYTEEQRMFMLGKDGQTLEDFDWDPGTMVPAGTKPFEHIRKFHFMIQPDSLLNIRRTEKIAMIGALRKGRDISRRSMYKILDINLDIDTVEKELKAEAEQGMPPGPPQKGKGGPKGGPPGMPH